MRLAPFTLTNTKCLGGGKPSSSAKTPTGCPLVEPVGMAASPAPSLPARGPGNQGKWHALPLPGAPRICLIEH